LNIIAKKLILWLIERIGDDSHSKEDSRKLLGIFTSMFINTGILILTVGADFKYSPFPFNKIPIQISYTDIGEKWYQEIPSILFTTIQI
jgi:hypothetical protein